MATVSELSMYQATAMKLQQQKRAASTKLEESKWRIANNEPPADETALELRRRKRAQYTAQDSRMTKYGADDTSSGSHGRIVRTAAEPRPNAYIPDVAHGLGIPKPYSSLAPFKPTEAGSTMRHFRPPQPTVITL